LKVANSEISKLKEQLENLEKIHRVLVERNELTEGETKALQEKCEALKDRILSLEGEQKIAHKG
jgi:DNA-binding Lrp family transcriptional regulator